MRYIVWWWFFGFAFQLLFLIFSRPKKHETHRWETFLICFSYCSRCQTIAKLRQLLNAYGRSPVDPHYTWRCFAFLLLCRSFLCLQQFLEHFEKVAFFVCLIIIIMLHTWMRCAPLCYRAACAYDTINVFGYCRFYYTAFRVSPAITLRCSSRSLRLAVSVDLMMHLLCVHIKFNFLFLLEGNDLRKETVFFRWKDDYNSHYASHFGCRRYHAMSQLKRIWPSTMCSLSYDDNH